MWYTISNYVGVLTRVCGLVACAAWLLVVPEGAADEVKGTGGAAETEAEGNEVSAFGKFLPIGRPNEGVVIPSFEGGVRASLVKAARMTRVDEDHLLFDDMLIETFLPDGSLDMTVKLLRARYHMPTAVLTSRSRSRVERPDFEIVGDGLVFDTETGRGRMTGSVEMLVYDVKEFGENQGISGGEDSAGKDGSEKPEPGTEPKGDE